MIEIARVEAAARRHGRRYLERIYTPAELAQAHQLSEYLAGRFAAKEAVAKALGTGIGVVNWKDIEILGDEQDAPVLNLVGAAKVRAESLGLFHWSVSITHGMGQALAFAVAIGS